MKVGLNNIFYFINIDVFFSIVMIVQIVFQMKKKNSYITVHTVSTLQYNLLA